MGRVLSGELTCPCDRSCLNVSLVKVRLPAPLSFDNSDNKVGQLLVFLFAYGYNETDGMRFVVKTPKKSKVKHKLQFSMFFKIIYLGYFNNEGITALDR